MRIRGQNQNIFYKNIVQHGRALVISSSPPRTSCRNISLGKQVMITYISTFFFFFKKIGSHAHQTGVQWHKQILLQPRLPGFQWSPCLSLLCHWDHRCVPPCPANVFTYLGTILSPESYDVTHSKIKPIKWGSVFKGDLLNSREHKIQWRRMPV